MVVSWFVWVTGCDPCVRASPFPSAPCVSRLPPVSFYLKKDTMYRQKDTGGSRHTGHNLLIRRLASEQGMSSLNVLRVLPYPTYLTHVPDPCTLPHADTSLKFPHRTSGGPTNW